MPYYLHSYHWYRKLMFLQVRVFARLDDFLALLLPRRPEFMTRWRDHLGAFLTEDLRLLEEEIEHRKAEGSWDERQAV
jgi:hypothetical protein